MNRKIPVPEKTAKEIDNKVYRHLSSAEKRKLEEHKGKVVYIDGMWYFLDMTHRYYPEDNADETT